MPEHRVTSLGHQGDGIAAGPVYIPRTLPGEIVSGEVTDGRVDAPRIIAPSPDRVTAPCAHFKSCGGCQLQHASDDFVARWKTERVRDALKKQDLTSEFRAIVTSPAQSRRRARFSARRTKSGALAGFHARASGTVIDIKACPILAPALAGAPDLCRALAKTGASRKGEMSILCTSVQGGLDVTVTGGKPLDEALRAELPPLAQAQGALRLIWDDELVFQEAVPQHVIGSARVPLPPGAFLQATDHGEAALQACVTEALGTAQSVVDLFSGCGTFALVRAQQSPVTAVEGDAAMTSACQIAANHAALKHPVTCVTRDLFKDPLTTAELGRFDAAILDPPRAGAQAQIEQIAQSGLNRVAYVSCDPASFARDAAHLVNAGFSLDWVQVVDQFRWSSHVELAAQLTRMA